jgi:hypothetical protein
LTLPSRSAGYRHIPQIRGANAVCPREGQDPPLQWGTIFILRLENVENMMYNICYEKIAVKEAYGAYGK